MYGPDLLMIQRWHRVQEDAEGVGRGGAKEDGTAVVELGSFLVNLTAGEEKPDVPLLNAEMRRLG